MEFETRTKTIKINGEEHELKEPSAFAISKLGRFQNIDTKKMSGKDLEDMILVGVEVVTDMGLPEDVAKRLPIGPLFEITSLFGTEGN